MCFVICTDKRTVGSHSVDGVFLSQPRGSSQPVQAPAFGLEVARGCQGAVHGWKLMGGADATAWSTVCQARVVSPWGKELPLQSPLALPVLPVTLTCAGHIPYPSRR